jgi:hypothetical protein
MRGQRGRAPAAGIKIREMDMSDHGNEHAGSSPVPFTEAEVQAFHEDDGRTATAVVCLMSGIFTMGLILYIGVNIWVQ